MDRAGQIEMLRAAVAIAGLDARKIDLPQDHQLIIGAMRFHYLDWGGNGHPMVFLHGGGLNAHTWDVVALMLRERYRCFALDQRGHGDSEWSPAIDYGVDTQMQDVEGFLDSLKLDNPVLVGQSMGGLNSMAYAVRHSERLKGLVVVDVGPEIEAAGTQRIREFASTPELASPEEFLERAIKFNPLRDRAVLRRSLFYNLRQLPSGKFALKHDQRRASEEASRISTAQRERLNHEVTKISCPTLIVRGALSDVLSDRGAEKFAGSLPRARWVRIEKAGHNVQGDNPRGLLGAITPFLKELGLAEGH
jgi:pimeloyl-ACP methyl ester carboxylesterase